LLAERHEHGASQRGPRPNTHSDRPDILARNQSTPAEDEDFIDDQGKLAVVLPWFQPMKAVTRQLPSGADTDAWSTGVKWDGQITELVKV
jgi:hypothetical protein